jgi:phosphoribosylformylglycinamidine synthase
MGGGAVSSVATGEFENAIELNAVQRANPEMQKRVFNAIRALAESDINPIISIHDHGAGGHFNCLSELVESNRWQNRHQQASGGRPNPFAKGNYRQRIAGTYGPGMHPENVELLQKIAERERAPIYVIGEATGDMQFTFENSLTGEKSIDWQLGYMFGKPPRTILEDKTE